MTEKAKDVVAVSFEIAMKIAMPFLIGVAGWTFTNILDHEKRLITIEATQPTREDIQAFSAALYDLRQSAAVRDERLAKMEESLRIVREFLASRDGAETIR